MILEKLRQLNEEMLIIHREDKKETKKQKGIQKTLQDDKCFFKMTRDQAYGMLRDLGIEEGALRPIYLQLIDAKEDESDRED